MSSERTQGGRVPRALAVHSAARVSRTAVRRGCREMATLSGVWPGSRVEVMVLRSIVHPHSHHTHPSSPSSSASRLQLPPHPPPSPPHILQRTGRRRARKEVRNKVNLLSASPQALLSSAYTWQRMCFLIGKHNLIFCVKPK